MTRQHFKALASPLAENRPTNTPALDHALTWKRTCESVASVCRGFNSHFDRCRFLEACDYYQDQD